MHQLDSTNIDSTAARGGMQNFFRSYPKLAGMTGTAATEVAEFNNIYNLNVAVVPTNKVRAVPHVLDRCLSVPDSGMVVCMLVAVE